MSYHLSDPPREKEEKREKSPEDYYPIIPKIPMKLEMPILEKELKEKGMHPNEKSKSKSAKGKPKKNNSKSKHPAMAKIQKKL